MVGRILGWRENLASSGSSKSKCGESSKEGFSKGAPSTCVFFTWYSHTSAKGNRKKRNNCRQHRRTTSVTSEETLNTSMSSESFSADSNDILAKLKAQLEFYFSVENLSRDTYLRSLFSSPTADAIQPPAAPLSAIANFPKVRALTTGKPDDTQLIQRAIETSTELSLSPDKMWIIPLKPLPLLDVAHSTELSSSSSSASLNSSSAPTAPMPQHNNKNVIVVADVPHNATPQMIAAAFSTADIQPKIVQPSSNPNTNATWYITFQNENDATKVLHNAKDVTIDGAPVQATIMPDNINTPPAHNGPPTHHPHAPHAHAYHAAHGPYHQPHHHSMPPMYHYPPQHTYHPNHHYPHHHSMPPHPMHHHHPYPPHMHELSYAHHHHYTQHASPLYHHTPNDQPHSMHLHHHAPPHAANHSPYSYAPYPLPHVNVPPPPKTSRKPKKDRKKNSYHHPPNNQFNASDHKNSVETSKKFSHKSSKEVPRMESYSHPKMKMPQLKQAQTTPSSSSLMNNQYEPAPFKFKPTGKKPKKQNYFNSTENTSSETKTANMKDTDLKCNVNFPALNGNNDDTNEAKKDGDLKIKGYAQALLQSNATSTGTSDNGSNLKTLSVSLVEEEKIEKLKSSEEVKEVETSNVEEVTDKMEDIKLVNKQNDGTEQIQLEDHQHQSDNTMNTKTVPSAVDCDEDKSKPQGEHADTSTTLEHKDAPSFTPEAPISNDDQTTLTQQQQQQRSTNTVSNQVCEDASPVIAILTEEEHPPLPTQKLESGKDKSGAVRPPVGVWGKKPSFVDVVRNET